MGGNDSYTNWNSCSALPTLLTSTIGSKSLFRRRGIYWILEISSILQRPENIKYHPAPCCCSTSAALSASNIAMTTAPQLLLQRLLQCLLAFHLDPLLRSASNIAMTTAPPAPASAPSPMPYGLPSGSALVKNDMRNSGIDRRKGSMKELN
ncbi:putative polyadenylate-binding protein [Hibiscus syriacus]|uniref:Polyadenylate-binding protein n=1 Tax=Hibiscus syriacus TaxID=106335 RepID=A0A6A2ZAN5_HIBSY|nr:putative polyadenylate-binding protein [Hibiscus syriacus]